MVKSPSKPEISSSDRLRRLYPETGIGSESFPLAGSFVLLPRKLTMEEGVAHANKRFINFGIDYLIFPFITSLFLGQLSFFLVFANFFVFEALTGKTLGKFFTKTRVVKRDRSKPGIIRIFVRFLVRFFPFDLFSFAFSLKPVGFHDVLSGTAVVDDVKLANKMLGAIKTKNDRYESVVKGINLASIATDKFLSKYPELGIVLNKSKHPVNDWDFFMTVGGVGLYIKVQKLDKNEVDAIKKQIKLLNKEMPAALDNLDSFLTNKSDLSLMTKVGFWVLWNIGGEAPSHIESERLAPAIGRYLTNVIGKFN